MNNRQFDSMRLPTHAFGRQFTHVPEHVRQDLVTLDREGAIYADHWIQEAGDFRHVRIEFTQDEQIEFARRSWAYELFLRAGAPKWARETPGIDEDVAKEADDYSPLLKDGTQVPPPYHCFASFLGKHLEALVCCHSNRETVINLSGRAALLFEIRRTVENLTPTIRSFNNREKGLAAWKIACEDDVRDLLYVMLRPRIFDITKEEAVPCRAGSHKFADLCSRAVEILIEVKWIGRRGRWRRIVDQIHIDTQTYIAHPACTNLLFVVIDAVRDIPDPRRLEADLTGEQMIEGRKIRISAIVCEP